MSDSDPRQLRRRPCHSNSDRFRKPGGHISTKWPLFLFKTKIHLHTTIFTFVDMVMNDLKKIQSYNNKNDSHLNVTKKEKVALEQLCNNEENNN